MTTLAKHFEHLAQLQRRRDDEIHRMQEDGDIKQEHGNYFVNLSDEIHTVRQGIERVKGLIGVQHEAG